MPKSRHRKNHKQKVQVRKKKIQDAKSRVASLQRKFIMDLINKEKEKGLFENNPTINGPILDGPILDGPILDGPVIDGPVIDNPVMETPVIESPVQSIEGTETNS